MLLDLLKKIVLTIASFIIGISCLVASFTITDIDPPLTVMALITGLLCLLAGSILWMPTNKWIMDLQDWWDRKNGT